MCLLLFLILLFLFVFWNKWVFTYWKRHSLHNPQPRFLFGNFADVFHRKVHTCVTLTHFYNIYKKQGLKHVGLYFSLWPVYLVLDLDYLKNILAKDFEYFSDRGLYYNENADFLTGHLLNVGGVKWRNLRTKLTPTFSSGKIKIMFHIITECVVLLQERMYKVCEKKEPINIKEIFECFTTDIIGSCAFGLECNTFKEENSPFRIYVKKVFLSSTFNQLKRTLGNMFPKFCQMLNLSVLPKDVSDFFSNSLKKTIDYRISNKIFRKDFLQLLIDLKIEDNNGKNDASALTVKDICAQSFVFFVAGFETSSTAMTFALYELAKHQNLQDKLRDEINNVLDKYQGQFTYDAIQEMKYLTQVIDEILRLYPPAPIITRRCVKDYKIPDSDVVIRKGTMVFISIFGIHRDEDYYPNPHKFDPDRFTEENKKLRNSYTHLPFGQGPRTCIGMRFAYLETKTGLAALIKNYKFSLNRKTIEPLEFNINSITLAAKGDIWLNAHKID